MRSGFIIVISEVRNLAGAMYLERTFIVYTVNVMHVVEEQLKQIKKGRLRIFGIVLLTNGVVRKQSWYGRIIEFITVREHPNPMNSRRRQ